MNQTPKDEIKPPVETTEVDPPISKIDPTEEELEGYFIVKSLLRDLVPSDRITHKDTESYFGILLDNNIRKWICRLQLNTGIKYIIIPDEQKKGIKHQISSIEDIYNLKSKLSEALKRVL